MGTIPDNTEQAHPWEVICFFHLLQGTQEIICSEALNVSASLWTTYSFHPVSLTEPWSVSDTGLLLLPKCWVKQICACLLASVVQWGGIRLRNGKLWLWWVLRRSWMWEGAHVGLEPGKPVKRMYLGKCNWKSRCERSFEKANDKFWKHNSASGA